MNNLTRLRRFIGDMTSLVGGAWQDKDEAATVEVGARLLGDLVSHDDWLPESMAKCPPHGYAQNMLWCDPLERFSVVLVVMAEMVQVMLWVRMLLVVPMVVLVEVEQQLIHLWVV